MEGPVLAFKAMLLVWVLMAIYKRFERVHGRFPEFERFLAERPVIAELRGPDLVVERVRERLQRGVVVGLGERPWPFYCVRFDVTREDDRVVLRPRAWRLLRVEESAPPELCAALDGLGPLEAWLHPTAYVDLDEGSRSAAGWRVSLTDGQRPPPCAISEVNTAQRGTSSTRSSRTFSSAPSPPSARSHRRSVSLPGASRNSVA